MAFSIDVLKEPKGALKIIEFIVAIICFAVVAGWDCGGIKITDIPGDTASRGAFLIAIGVLAFIYSLAFLVLFLLAEEKVPEIFYLIDLIICGFFSFMFLLASALLAAAVDNGISGASGVCSPGQLTAGAIFGFVNWILWSGNIWFAYKDYRDYKLLRNGQSGAGSGSGSAGQGRSGGAANQEYNDNI